MNKRKASDFFDLTVDEEEFSVNERVRNTDSPGGCEDRLLLDEVLMIVVGCGQISSYVDEK